MNLLKLLDELDALEKEASPGPWDGYDNIQPVRNRDFILTLRNNWPRISKAVREAEKAMNCTGIISGMCSMGELCPGCDWFEKYGGEDRADLEAAREAMKEVAAGDTVSLDEVKKEL